MARAVYGRLIHRSPDRCQAFIEFRAIDIARRMAGAQVSGLLLREWNLVEIRATKLLESERNRGQFRPGCGPSVDRNDIGVHACRKEHPHRHICNEVMRDRVLQRLGNNFGAFFFRRRLP